MHSSFFLLLYNVEIKNTGFAGIMAKTDPTCSNPKTWRTGGYILQNLNLHHNYIHDTFGEGMYIGYTGGYMVESKKVCDGEYAFGHFLENVQIYDNIVESHSYTRHSSAISLNRVDNIPMSQMEKQLFRPN